MGCQIAYCMYCMHIITYLRSLISYFGSPVFPIGYNTVEHQLVKLSKTKNIKNFFSNSNIEKKQKHIWQWLFSLKWQFFIQNFFSKNIKEKIPDLLILLRIRIHIILPDPRYNIGSESGFDQYRKTLPFWDLVYVLRCIKFQYVFHIRLYQIVAFSSLF